MKLSTNEYYSGKHWSARAGLKDTYSRIVKAQTKAFFPKTGQYEVQYDFSFNNRPLDCSNCSMMVKMIEDILFESDSPNVVKKVTITSCKAKVVYPEVTITILEIN